MFNLLIMINENEDEEDVDHASMLMKVWPPFLVPPSVALSYRAGRKGGAKVT